MFSCVRVSAVDGDDEEVAAGTSPSTHKEMLPMRSKKNNNPFSARGLDRFAVLSAELQARRQKIMAQLGDPQADDVTVRFAYSPSIGWVPVIIKQSKSKPQEKQLDPKHHRRQQNHKPSAVTMTPKPLPKVAIGSPPPQSSVSWSPEQKKGEGRSEEKGRREQGSLLGWKSIKTLACYGFSLAHSEPLTLVAILLLCLVISGRTFAVLFTVFWWYLGAVFRELDIDGSKSKMARSVRKKKGRRYQVPQEGVVVTGR